MIYILTVVHNNLAATKSLIRCLEKQSFKQFKLVVVDDKSTDGTRSFLERYSDQFLLLYGDGNLWWTGGLNLGVKQILKMASANDYILIINNDCEFDKSYLSVLFRSAIKLQKTVVGSLAVSAEQPTKIWDAGVIVDWDLGQVRALYPVNTDITVLNKNKLQYNIDTITTKGTLYPVKLFKQIGLFDRKHFPHYLSDYEFGIRAKNAGWELAINYKAIVRNDTKNSGFDYNSRTVLSTNFFSLLFGKRSRVNIVDQINFIRYCCPKGYKVRNFYLLVVRVLFAWGKVYL